MTQNSPNVGALANPFPSAAVARLSHARIGQVSIVTAATERAFSYVDEYLKSTEADSKAAGSPTRTYGNVMAIVGEYGTGKTHLALQLLGRLRGRDYKSTSTLYLDAPADTFLALYRDRFFPKISRSDFRLRISEYYSDVLADQLSGSELTAKASDSLRAREVSPDSVIRNLGLMESELRAAVSEKLRTVTDFEQFAVALTLMLRPEFEDAVWEWFACGIPDPALIERGVSEAIDSDQTALEAMGVIALVYGNQNHDFVLIIDELEKVLSADDDRRPEEAVVLAFKKLLEVFGSTRAFLVLCGLPDFLEALPEDARQRIGCIVRPVSLSARDVAKYIEDSQAEAFGKASLLPFTDDSIEYIVELASGNPRKIIRLCYYAFQFARKSGTNITRAMVRNVAREQFEATSTEEVEASIARLLDSRGWLYEEEKRVANKKRTERVDYWIPAAGGGEGGTAILLSGPLLDASVLRRLERRADVIRASTADSLVYILVVVNGFLLAEHSSESDKIDRFVPYDSRRFSETLGAILSGFRQRLDAVQEKSQIALVQERVEELSRQSASLRTGIDEILARTLEPQSVEVAVQAGVRRVFGELAGGQGSVSRASTALDPQFLNLEKALAALADAPGQAFEAITNSRRLGRERFDVRSPSDGSYVVNLFFRDSEFIRAAALSRYFLDALRMLRAAIDEAITTSVSQSGSWRMSARDNTYLLDHVATWCQAFDSISERSAGMVDWAHAFEILEEISRVAVREFGFNLARPPAVHSWVGFNRELALVGARAYRSTRAILEGNTPMFDEDEPFFR
jgi:hypothetical protein